jgi:hypothetical protein
MDITVQELLTQDFFKEENENKNELIEVLEFTRLHGVPLTKEQVRGILILRENGLEDLAIYALNMKSLVTPTRKYFNMVNKLTLADRIKGNAKLSSILKANANPANGFSMADAQPKMMRKSEIG